MTERELKSYVLRLFKKSISDKQFRNAVNNLEQLKDIDPKFYYFNMGKLHTAFGDVDQAIAYLGKMIMLDEHYAAAYYNLYKCYVKKNDIDMASHALNVFLANCKSDVNFEFASNLLQAITLVDADYLGYLKEDFKVSDDTRFGYNNLSDNEAIAKLYKEVIATFNERNYVLCLQKLHLMNTKIGETNYPMEVDTLISLVKTLKEKEILKVSKMVRDEKLGNCSDEDYCKFNLRLVELGNVDEKSILRKIDEMLNNNSIGRAREMLNMISSSPRFTKYQDMIQYLEGIVREKAAFMMLDEDRQQEFTKRRLKAKAMYKRKQNDKSLQVYGELKEEFGLPICDYYMAKILFRQKKFAQAKELFLSYLEQGGTKTEKAYMFLAKIERIAKNNSEAKRYTNKMRRVHEVFNRDFDYIPEKAYRKRKKLGEVDDKLDQNDTVKKKRTGTIRMSEDDFNSSQEMEVTDFYETGIDGKLSIIRGLLQTGHVKTANKLFEEVQRECAPEERGKVMQFDRNRKIYKNQKRTSNS